MSQQFLPRPLHYAVRPIVGSVLAALAVTSLSGCLTRQMWQPSYEADTAHAVEVPMVGQFTPDREVPKGAGGTAWRAVATPFSLAADGGISFVLFFSDLAGLGYGAGDWMMRQTPKPGTSSPTAAEFGNLPSWFLARVNVPLVDAGGREITFVAMPADRQVYVGGIIEQTRMLSVAEHEAQANQIQLAGYSATIPHDGQANVAVTVNVYQVDAGWEIEGSYLSPRDGAREAHPISKGVFHPKKP